MLQLVGFDLWLDPQVHWAANEAEGILSALFRFVTNIEKTIIDFASGLYISIVTTSGENITGFAIAAQSLFVRSSTIMTKKLLLRFIQQGR